MRRAGISESTLLLLLLSLAPTASAQHVFRAANFGFGIMTCVGSRLESSAILMNPRSDTLEITSIRLTFGTAFTIKSYQHTLPPNSQTEVIVSFIPPSSGQFSDALTVVVSDGRTPDSAVVPFNGTGVDAFLRLDSNVKVLDRTSSSPAEGRLRVSSLSELSVFIDSISLNGSSDFGVRADVPMEVGDRDIYLTYSGNKTPDSARVAIHYRTCDQPHDTTILVLGRSEYVVPIASAPPVVSYDGSGKITVAIKTIPVTNLRLVSVDGRILRSWDSLPNTSDLDVSGIAIGAYFLHYETAEASYVFKLVILH